MKNPLRALTTPFLYRRLLRTTTRIADALDRQNVLLARLADEFAPIPPAPSDLELKDSGPTFARDVEQGQILDYVDRVIAATGREPTEEEIVEYLDELKADGPVRH